MQETRPEKPKKSWKREALEWILVIVVAVAVVLPIRHFVFSPFVVRGHSMDETLADGEVMLATKYDYLAGDPARFDVVICRYPGRSENFVKRVVGVPGDVVALREGYLYVNGERYEEPYVTYRPGYTIAPYTVREGEYYVLGDNRANSNDSHLIGPITREQIIAHVRGVFFPFTRLRAIR